MLTRGRRRGRLVAIFELRGRVARPHIL